jgi:SAM-dependent methyltransferase
MSDDARGWHEDESFWLRASPVMFNAKRLAETPSEVDRVLSLAKPPAGASVLDLPCGPGRHSLELARRGFRVTGVDRTLSYLDRARELARASGLELELVQDDMRRFAREGAFDLVLNLFGSFGFFEDPGDDRAVLENAHRTLRPGGSLVLEFRGKESLALGFREREWFEQDGVILMEERRVLDGWSRIDARWILVDAEGRAEFRLSIALYSAQEIAALLRSCGFSEVRTFGDLSGSPYDHKAQRLVVLALRT